MLPDKIAFAVSDRQERRLVYRMMCIAAKKNEADWAGERCVDARTTGSWKNKGMVPEAGSCCTRKNEVLRKNGISYG